MLLMRLNHHGERITQKGDEKQAKTTKLDSEWKSLKGQSQIKAKDQKSQSQSQHNKSTYQNEASPGYIPESDPEEDLEEDDEEDPADYPADRGDDDDAEDEHLAPAEPAAVAYSADQDPYIAYRVTARMSIRTQAPAPFLSEEVAERVGLGDPTAGIRTESCNTCYEMRMRDVVTACKAVCTTPVWMRGRRAAPVTRMSRELGYGIRDTWDDLVGAIQEIAPTTLEGVNQRVIELSSTVDQEDEIIYSQLDDARYDRALLRARVNRLDSDRPFHRRTALLIEEEARLSRAAWARSMDACDQVHSEGMSLRTTVMAQQSEITELQAADRRRQAVITDLLKADYRRQRQLAETLKIVKSLKAQMTELQRQQGPAKDPAEPELPEEAGSSS
ncbi:hypothetical protein Tco_0752044 [Tanacetum coccineum]|uniref:Uncharacterized protein n=1 Tax=Tanacetum coccineum TaxID=301880 RepID=A0ABQ4Z9A4_9ASTR